MISPVIDVLIAMGSSGAMASAITAFIGRRKDKVDISQKVINFWEAKADNYLERQIQLEVRVSALEKLKCEKSNCPDRI